jgi:hypothetical protein
MPWRKIVAAIDDIAQSHTLLSERIEKDVEQPLRSFATTNREMSAMSTIQGNLSAMARELEDAQDKSDKLNRKGGKASTLKVDAATSKLQTANSQWDSQAPFIFEQLQALDERRLNHLRDVLTQYETHEADVIERNRKTVEQTLSALLEIDTAQEIKNWSQASVAGKPLNERRVRQSSNAGSGSGGTASLPPPPTPRSTTDNQSEHSGGGNEKGGKNILLRSALRVCCYKIPSIYTNGNQSPPESRADSERCLASAARAYTVPSDGIRPLIRVSNHLAEVLQVGMGRLHKLLLATYAIHHLVTTGFRP